MPGLVILGALLAAASPAPPETKATYPKVRLERDGAVLDVYLPDPETGYYRGPRFDWSGMVARAAWNGHTFFGPWKTPHKPEALDHGIGTAGEFGMASPLGYEGAKTGEPFYKIGVGALEKPEPKLDAEGEREPYGFAKRYRILKPAPWTVTRGPTHILSVQEMKGERGWGWRLAKRVEILEGGGGFVVAYALTNTGTKRIATDHYSHNFIRIDDVPVGPDYRVLLPFGPTVAKMTGTLRVEGRALMPGPKAWATLEGFGPTAADNAATVVCTKTGASLALRTDRPLAKYAFYAEPTAICPEPFVELDVPPGEAVRWTTTYTFGEARPDASGAVPCPTVLP